MENLEFEFIDRAITLLKEDGEAAATYLIHQECDLNLTEARTFVSLLHQMMS